MKLTLLSEADFESAFTLLEQSFPPDERRPRHGQKALLGDERYRLLGVKNRGTGSVEALLALWDLGEVLFIEHFAVLPQNRGLGLGSAMLCELRRNTNQPLCLEVELPETDTARRRIAFYERAGFFYNPYPYFQPPLHPTQKGLPLRLMSSPAPLDEGAFLRTKALLYSQIYHTEP